MKVFVTNKKKIIIALCLLITVSAAVIGFIYLESTQTMKNSGGLPIYGVQTDLPWGFIFDLNGETVPKHPTQLYESFSYFLIFLVSLLVYRKQDGKLRPGALFGWWLIALFGVRLLVEFVKEEQVAFEQGMTLDMGQWLSIPFILLGVLMCILAYKGKFNEHIILKKDEKILKK